MINYIWFNPVVKSLVNEDKLALFCKEFNYNEVNVEMDWLNHVKQGYYHQVIQTKKTILDMRCPMAIDLIKDKVDDNYVLPMIHPILIHCALDLALKYVDDKHSLTITTPCRSLADYGNNLNLDNVTFISWIDLLKQYEYKVETYELNDSPIPPGFFNLDKLDVVYLDNKEEITNYFNTKQPKADIVEMLYCHNGCHNGDGIVEI